MTDALLAEIEVLAVALDALDREPRRGREPYRDHTLAAEIAVRRQRVLFEMDVAGVLAPGERARLTAYPTLLGYHDAATAMRRYFASAARARYVSTPAPDSVIDSVISLDWFRTSTRYVAERDSPEEWLALCERDYDRFKPDSAPTIGFTKLEGRLHAFSFRYETGAGAPKLWRVVPEGMVLPERGSVRPIESAAGQGEFPLQREPGGSYRITEHVYGTADRGCYRGVRLLDGEPVIVALGSPQTLSRREIGDALQLDGPRIVPLRQTLDLVEANQAPASVLVEDAPAGVPLATLSFPLPLREVAALGIALCESLEPAHANRQVVRGIRPELVYVDASRTLTGLVPRCERFWSLAPMPGYGVAPVWDHLYLSPELVASKADIMPASDVFSLCVLLATIASGEHPFASDSLIAQITAIATGKRHAWMGPGELAKLLDAGLAVDPAARPSATRVREMLQAAT